MLEIGNAVRSFSHCFFGKLVPNPSCTPNLKLLACVTTGTVCFAISHWRGRSPLTQCWRYRAACDEFLGLILWFITCLFFAGTWNLRLNSVLSMVSYRCFFTGSAYAGFALFWFKLLSTNRSYILDTLKAGSQYCLLVVALQ